MDRRLIGCKIRVELLGNWKYTGIVEDADEDFLVIADEKLKNEVFVNRSQIARLEVLK